MIELAKEIGEIYSHIKELSINADVGSLMDELDWCNAMLARSAQLEAETEAYLDRAKGNQSELYTNSLKASGEKFNATQSKLYIESRIIEENKLHRLAERLNATLTHRIDSIRTKISFEKSLRDNSRH